MDNAELESLKQIFEAYKKSTMIAYGSPDQYQYHQNQLIKKIAEHILVKFYKWAQQQYNEKQLEKHKGI
jgi:predicted protein tyrosine phosphatase